MTVFYVFDANEGVNLFVSATWIPMVAKWNFTITTTVGHLHKDVVGKLAPSNKRPFVSKHPEWHQARSCRQVGRRFR
jgi:hypothetical protein